MLKDQNFLKLITLTKNVNEVIKLSKLALNHLQVEKNRLLYGKQGLLGK